MFKTLSKSVLAPATLCAIALLTGCAQSEFEESWDVVTDGDDDTNRGPGAAPVGPAGEENVGSASLAISTGKTYRIHNVLHSDRCMGIAPVCHPNENGACLGTPVMLTDCTGPNTQWQIETFGSNIRLLHLATGKVILMAGPCSDNGGAAVLFTDTSTASANRDFVLEQAGTNHCIKSVHSGRYLTFPGSSINTNPLGAAVYQYGLSCTSDAWKWSFEEL